MAKQLSIERNTAIETRPFTREYAHARTLAAEASALSVSGTHSPSCGRDMEKREAKMHRAHKRTSPRRTKSFYYPTENAIVAVSLAVLGLILRFSRAAAPLFPLAVSIRDFRLIARRRSTAAAMAGRPPIIIKPLFTLLMQSTVAALLRRALPLLLLRSPEFGVR